MKPYSSEPEDSKQGFPGASFVSALEEYTKRIENSVGEIEGNTENTLTRLFALLIFVMLISAALPLAVRLTDELQSSTAYKSFFQAAIVFSVVAIIMLTLFTVYIRLLKLRRVRRNLETLLWPYQKLLQKLSQILDYGNLDDGTSTLIQLKILEAEVAYGRARRLIYSRSPLSRLLFGAASREPSFDPAESRYARDRYTGAYETPSAPRPPES